jgi:2-oxoglutarate dehydrogenase E1 component
MDKPSHDKALQSLQDNSILAGVNIAYLESVYDDFLRDPNSVPSPWRTYFQVLQGDRHDVSHAEIRAVLKRNALHSRADAAVNIPRLSDVRQYEKQLRIEKLIDAYRFLGHQKAAIDPLGLWELPPVSELDYRHYGFSDSDLETVFDAKSFSSLERSTLRELIQALEETYCGHIGSEYMHITTMTERRWIQHRLEGGRARMTMDSAARKRLLYRLTMAEGLERYLHTRYVGQKRFSLEGAESLVPMLDELIQRSGNHGAQELVIGMAHRGRLNVLVNIMGKTPAELFMEFEGTYLNDTDGTGDVKYHMGFSSNIRTQGRDVHVALAFNPSHLEIVSPVVEGSARARQDRRKDREGNQVVPVMIHGDAAFAGQGVVMETFNMSQSRGYSTKGTVHIVVDNQIGFTTSNQKDMRSTVYCTDVAKMVNAPIFHVNGDDPEAVMFIIQLALDYRMTFHKDVVIDLVCYRRHGHSEADEPTVTQPQMYQIIHDLATVREAYAERLVEDAIITEEDAQHMVDSYVAALEQGDVVVDEWVPDSQSTYEYEVDWAPYKEAVCDPQVDTCVSENTVRETYDKIADLPEGFVVHPNVAKILSNRKKMAAGALAVDWGFAETMAYATLLNDGYSVRLSGQDCGRGTFFHRHVVLTNQRDNQTYIPLRNLGNGGNNFLAINSLLSEEAVLAFEYGYATTDPGTLVIWEAQFGDFANNAQVVIDQFISAGEQKWNRKCGLVMMLPHGYEGQGPEHSSARLERYLQLCAQHNMQVAVPSTPVQMFHLLRRQMHLRCRVPLVIMTPKSLLRHRLAISSIEELSESGFRPVIGEVDDIDPGNVRRVILCSGKVYYDLLDKRRQDERNDVAILRMEQLYPFPEQQLKNELRQFKNAGELVWCQEEPKNQGAWYASQHHIRGILRPQLELTYAGRPYSAAPAVGRVSLHIKQQHDLLAEALGQ